MTRPIILLVTEGALEIPAGMRLLRALRIDTKAIRAIDKGGQARFWSDAERYNRAAANVGIVLGLADAEGLAAFLEVAPQLIPSLPDRDRHPKQTLVNIARQSHRRELRNDLVPGEGSHGIVGKGYTLAMTEFVAKFWSPMRAARRSPSLDKAMAAILAAVRGSGTRCARRR